jgi:serine/threonine-protein kinase HipA
LKNFWVLCDSRRGWRLSPAFDLVPDIGQRGEHVLLFDLDPLYPGRKTLARLGRSWGISHCTLIVEEVFEAVARWREEYASFGIKEKEILQFDEIDRHLVS